MKWTLLESASIIYFSSLHRKRENFANHLKYFTSSSHLTTNSEMFGQSPSHSLVKLRCYSKLWTPINLHIFPGFYRNILHHFLLTLGKINTSLFMRKPPISVAVSHLALVLLFLSVPSWDLTCDFSCRAFPVDWVPSQQWPAMSEWNEVLCMGY